MLRIISRCYIFVYRLFEIKIETGVRIWPRVFISKGYSTKKGSVYISKRCEISNGCILKAYGGAIHIDENTFLGEYVIMYGHGGIEIGKNTLIAMHTCIVSSNHTIPSKVEKIRDKGDILLPVKIGNDVWIGAGCKILGGITIGDGCVIGAGSVVTKDILPYSIAMGVPAQIKGTRND
ncbi:acyltransferase [Pedobacter sp. MW01-1-1]|uniref:acyltransferase n=1 Tax=Pedobacter sp. MW01-1-1 TaxID=3383027 RepID=UPI003FF0CA75